MSKLGRSNQSSVPSPARLLDLDLDLSSDIVLSLFLAEGPPSIWLDCNLEVVWLAYGSLAIARKTRLSECC